MRGDRSKIVRMRVVPLRLAPTMKIASGSPGSAGGTGGHSSSGRCTTVSVPVATMRNQSRCARHKTSGASFQLQVGEARAAKGPAEERSFYWLH